MKFWSVLTDTAERKVRIALDGSRSIITFDANEARDIAVAIMIAADRIEEENDRLKLKAIK
jgi:hypothetical protein